MEMHNNAKTALFMWQNILQKEVMAQSLSTDWPIIDIVKGIHETIRREINEVGAVITQGQALLRVLTGRWRLSHDLFMH